MKFQNCILYTDYFSLALGKEHRIRSLKSIHRTLLFGKHRYPDGAAFNVFSSVIEIEGAYPDVSY